MRGVVRAVLLCGIILVGTTPVRADSLPVIAGAVFGVELCPQSLCGTAVFVGVFSGRVGFNPYALGTIGVAVHHGPLPEIAGDCTPIPDGVWELRVGLRRFRGTAAGGLCYNGDNTYGVAVTMELQAGGIGNTTFEGTLDHNVFPPTIVGVIAQ